MAGSGGSRGARGRLSPDQIKELIRSAEDRTKDAEYETTVSQYLADLLGSYNDRDVDAITERLDEIKGLIEDEIEGSVDLRFGGSIQKHTYIDGLSDIDSLVFLSDDAPQEWSPRELITHFRDQLANYLEEAADVRQGDMAVTVVYPDGMEIQLLPAVRTTSGIKVAAMGGQEWSPIIRPERFARKLTDVNALCNQRLIPVIKLAKGAISQLPKNQQLTGYHVESLAVEVFESYSGPKTSKAMLTHFFAKASELVLLPIRDVTGQSRRVDDDLGPQGSGSRLDISATLSRISRRMKNADAAGSVEVWLAAIGEAPS